MIAPFDIFRVDSTDGALIWCATAESLDAAKERVATLGKMHRAQFVIVSIKTGRRLTIDLTSPDAPAPGEEKPDPV